MNQTEAKMILGEKVKELKKLSYAELCKLLEEIQTGEVAGPSGTRYQWEVQAVWDDKKEKNLRVLISIDDGGLRAFCPLTTDFIVAPGGKFIGE